MERIVKIDSISQLHELMGYDKPKHPLISLIDYSKIKPTLQTSGLDIITGFYSISLKDGKNCGAKYGRQFYDFQEGSLAFIEPEHAIYIDEEVSEEAESSGWNLCFHPDLIYKSSLDKSIREYLFFTYNSNEALHLSDQEKQIITHITHEIENEISQNLDVFSQDLVVLYLELLLNYCKRFYGRQFITRTKIKNLIEDAKRMLVKHLEETPGISTSDNYKKIFDIYIQFVTEHKKMIRVAIAESAKSTSKLSVIMEIADMSINTELNSIRKKYGLQPPKDKQELIIFEFFTGFAPFLNYALYMDQWESYYNISQEELEEKFYQAFKRTHLMAHLSQ